MSKIKDLTLSNYVKGIRVQTNCQHTESIGEGYFGKIVFSKNLSVAR